MPCSSHDIFPGSSVKLGKESSCSAGIQVQSLSWEDPLEKEMANYSVFLTEKSHGQRILTGYCPKDGKESDMTEQLSTSITELFHTFSLLVYSCVDSRVFC